MGLPQYLTLLVANALPFAPHKVSHIFSRGGGRETWRERGMNSNYRLVETSTWHCALNTVR